MAMKMDGLKFVTTTKKEQIKLSCNNNQKEKKSKQNCENHYKENTIMSHCFFFGFVNQRISRVNLKKNIQCDF